ncbi:MAG TPA: SDR family oxidoreductase [Acidimicrobiia bacterium]|jgi:NAD(P)-dependent dehydrogenase (short-subunit alcohol dehydrogenase family)
MERFEGRTALVTGAGGGIGRATCSRLAAEGASVVCADVDASAAAATADALPAGKAVAVACDVTDPVSARAAVGAATERFGALDVLVNVAGVGAMRSTRELALDEWQRTLQVNLTGTFLMNQAAIEAMLTAGGGAIVNMASVAGLRATPYNAAYCASKGGVVMLTKSLAVEFGRSGIRVNCVCPSMVDTSFLDDMALPSDADFSLFTRAGSVITRKSTPDEIAGVIAFLASDEAAMITGVAYVVDGGATA